MNNIPVVFGCSVFLLISLIGCDTGRFDALGCEWRKPSGYSPIPQGAGYWVDYGTSSKKYSSIIKLEDKDENADVGELVYQLKHDVLDVSVFEKSLSAPRSPGLKSYFIERDGFDGAVWIADEEVTTFLIHCK